MSKKIFLIGEIGINHNGDINLCKKSLMEQKLQVQMLLNFKKEI